MSIYLPLWLLPKVNTIYRNAFPAIYHEYGEVKTGFDFLDHLIYIGFTDLDNTQFWKARMILGKNKMTRLGLIRLIIERS